MTTQVTCVIPTIGRSELLREALVSVASQAGPGLGLEVIIVNDTDDELSQIETPSNMCVTIVKNQLGEKGASAARNYGASCAKNAILAFLDDDDFWLEGHVAEACKMLENPSIDYVVNPIRYGSGSSARIDRIIFPVALVDVLHQNPGITGSNLVIRSDAFWAVGGFDPELRVSNDKDILARLIIAGHQGAAGSSVSVQHRAHAGPRLTDWGAKRGERLKAYRQKWNSELSTLGRLHLDGQILSCYARDARGLPKVGLTVRLIYIRLRYFVVRSVVSSAGRWSTVRDRMPPQTTHDSRE